MSFINRVKILPLKLSLTVGTTDLSGTPRNHGTVRNVINRPGGTPEQAGHHRPVRALLAYEGITKLSRPSMADQSRAPPTYQGHHRPSKATTNLVAEMLPTYQRHH